MDGVNPGATRGNRIKSAGRRVGLDHEEEYVIAQDKRQGRVGGSV